MPRVPALSPHSPGLRALDVVTLPPASPIVFVADGDLPVREVLDAMVRDAGWEVRAVPSATALLSEPEHVVANCLVLDVSLPELGGILAQGRLAVERAETPVICLTGHPDVSMTVRAMKAGAIDVLVKPIRPEMLLEAVRHALERSEAVLRQGGERRQLRERYASLSPRERQVMDLVVCGLLNKQVGGELGISEITVKAHRGKMMRKMNARSLAALVKIAAKLQAAPPFESH